MAGIQKGRNDLEQKMQKLLFGLTLPVSEKVKDAVEDEVTRRFPGIQTVCRYRKEGIYQYVSQQDSVLVIMEENLQGGGPYTMEEMQQLTDLGNNRIIFLMEQDHVGDEYVKMLYCCGIYDALYLEDASPKEIIRLIHQGRTGEQARKYYGILTLRDTERMANMVNEVQLGAYIEFIEAETDREELGKRYRFASTRLGTEENRILAASLTGEAAQKLKGNEVFEYYKGGNRERRRLFSRSKKAGKAPEESTQQTDTKQTERKPVMPRPVSSKDAKQDEDEIYSAIDRFWEVNGGGQVDEEDANLLVMFGGYLKTIDN